MCGAVVYLDANDSHLHYMLYSRMTGCGAELVPLCSLPCSIRFGVWCLRVARLSAQGRELARQRLDTLRAQGAEQMAVMVVDPKTAEVLALVGSSRYADAESGMIDYALR